MGLILNIETSTNVCSVCLVRDGKIIANRQTNEDKSHASKLTVFIAELFRESNYSIQKIDAVGVSKGPGSYTGLRIGVSTAKGIAYALNKPLIAIETLQTMAWEVIQKQKETDILFCPMLDARRMEVYSAIFNAQNKKIRKVKAEIINENSFTEELKTHKIVFFGNGSNKCKKYITHTNAQFIDDIVPLAENMTMLSEQAFINRQFEDTAYFEPFYLKDFVATVPKKNIFGTTK